MVALRILRMAAHYDFDLLSVLVVEDSAFTRQLLMSALNALGIYRVKYASHGGDAIDLLRLMKKDPARAGIMSIDMVLSDWDMQPVDGSLLLKWLRRSSESPNRYIPFLVLTAHSEPEIVKAARDLGATDMIAKPFSVDAIARKVVDAVERPRMFVQSPSYFGPDRRRRRAAAYSGEERRSIGLDTPGVSVIHE